MTDEHARADREALRPCPFCGGKAELTRGQAVLEDWPQGRFSRVYCGSCQTRQLFHKSDAKAIAAWNRRAELASLGDPPAQHAATERVETGAQGVTDEIVGRFCEAYREATDGRSTHTDMVRFALKAVWPTSAAAVPEGWQLVPKEPTQEMTDEEPDWDGPHQGPYKVSLFKAMLAAAPQPPTRPSGEAGSDKNRRLHHALLAAAGTAELMHNQGHATALRDAAAVLASTPPAEHTTQPRASGEQSEELKTLREALERISGATPRNTNSNTADDMRSWCKAVADTALSRASG